MNEVSKKQITDALHTIQNVCKYYTDNNELCKEDCPLCKDECMLLNKAPSEWNVNTPNKETWKALL